MGPFVVWQNVEKFFAHLKHTNNIAKAHSIAVPVERWRGQGLGHGPVHNQAGRCSEASPLSAKGSPLAQRLEESENVMARTW